jgi:peptidoglycan/xylan/chitin deacetylase (PgdA/CDA1 family)
MKRLALEFLQGCGMFGLARVASARMARILMYHNFCADGEGLSDHVSVSVLRRQLQYLSRHFRVVSLSQLIGQLRAGQPLDNHTVVLTIDDGRRNCYQYLYPLLREFRMPATFFVVSSFIRGESWIWTDKVLWLADRTKRPDFLASERIDAFFAFLNRLHPEVRDAHIEALSMTMGVHIPDNPPPKCAPCSWSELREMADSGLVEIGSHTVSHPILATLNDEESWSELAASREQIEEGLGGEITAFCFPNGKPEDFRASQVEQLKAAGYASAVVTRYGMVTEKASLFDLPRIGISGRTDPLIFSKYLDGAEYYQARLEGSLGVRAMAQSSAS